MDHAFVSSVFLLSALVATGPRTVSGVGGDDWVIRRVGGDLEIQTEFKVDRYTCGDCTVGSPLPVGYPAPTPPGALELKRYPSVRRAEVSGERDPDRHRNGAFWSLFTHIKKRDIAMTAPVEVDYRERPGEAPSSGDWTMSFLYRSPDLGPTGAEGPVSVVDTEPLTVLSIGLRGPYGQNTVNHGRELLEAWLEAESDWEKAGAARSLYYNGPHIPDSRKWAEVQIPVRPASAPALEVAGVSTAQDAPRQVLSPAQLIELAVQRGAPLFNDHQPQACAAIYEVTAQWLLAAPSLDPDARVTLQTALDEMDRQVDPREQAWALRRALDRVHGSLSASASASNG